MNTRILFLLLAGGLSACSALIAYKDQPLAQLHTLAQQQNNARGQIISFTGDIKGVDENTRRLRLVLKIDTPFYYHLSAETLSYQLLLVSFDKKEQPAMTGLRPGQPLKVLGRIAKYETRKNFTGSTVAVLYIDAIALADRPHKRDFFHTTLPDKQLYESWKAGRLFYKEQPAAVEAQYTPVPPAEKEPVLQPALPPAQELPKPETIVYDAEETFIIN